MVCGALAALDVRRSAPAGQFLHRARDDGGDDAVRGDRQEHDHADAQRGGRGPLAEMLGPPVRPAGPRRRSPGRGTPARASRPRTSPGAPDGPARAAWPRRFVGHVRPPLDLGRKPPDQPAGDEGNGDREDGGERDRDQHLDGVVRERRMLRRRGLHGQVAASSGRGAAGLAVAGARPAPAPSVGLPSRITSMADRAADRRCRR